MTVGSVAKAVAILRHLAGAKPQGVNAIARAVAVSPSTCFGILRTLVAEGFLDFDPAAKTYRIGSLPGLLFGADNTADMDDWRTWLADECGDLATTYFATVGIWQVRADRVELIRVADSPSDTRLHLTVGQRLPAYIGAMGRCIAARERLTMDELEAVIDGLRWEAPPVIKDYARDVRKAGTSGWAADEGNYIRGVTTLATAIAGVDDTVRFCLTASTFSGQFDKAAIERVGRAIADLGRAAEQRLKAIAPPPARRDDASQLAASR